MATSNKSINISKTKFDKTLRFWSNRYSVTLTSKEVNDLYAACKSNIQNAKQLSPFIGGVLFAAKSVIKPVSKQPGSNVKEIKVRNSTPTPKHLVSKASHLPNPEGHANAHAVFDSNGKRIG